MNNSSVLPFVGVFEIGCLASALFLCCLKKARIDSTRALRTLTLSVGFVRSVGSTTFVIIPSHFFGFVLVFLFCFFEPRDDRQNFMFKTFSKKEGILCTHPMHKI